MTEPYWVHTGDEFADESCYPTLAVPIANDQGDDTERARPKAPRSVNRSDWELALINCPDVPRAAKAVGWVLSRSADFESGRNAYPSQASIAAALDYSKTTPVSQQLEVLRDDGWIYRDGKGPAGASGYRPDRYRLTLPKCPHKHDGSALPRVEK